MLIVFATAQITFWTSNWIEYHTGVLQTSVGNFGVTESEIICILIHLLTGIFGQEFWGITLDTILPSSVVVHLSQSLPVLDLLLKLKVKMLIAYSLSSILIIVACLSFMKVVRKNN